jgi:hypothetical protein
MIRNILLVQVFHTDSFTIGILIISSHERMVVRAPFNFCYDAQQRISFRESNQVFLHPLPYTFATPIIIAVSYEQFLQLPYPS